MLLSGLFWAFTIGNLVSIVEHMNSERNTYKRSLDDANTVIGSFAENNTTNDAPNEESEIGVGDPTAIATRIRRFVTCQYDRAIPKLPSKCSAPTLDQVYPILKGFSPDLRKLSSLQLMQKYLEMIPYLSSEYLSPEEQSHLAFQCQYLEFSRGESFVRHPEYGRGILILRRGMALCLGTVGCHGFAAKSVSFQIYGLDDPIAVNEVLVEDEFLEDEVPIYRFSSYSIVVFIPQSVIYEVLNANAKAWRNCARWRYLQTCLAKWAKDRIMNRQAELT